jgi:hypothetical protein
MIASTVSKSLRNAWSSSSGSRSLTSSQLDELSTHFDSKLDNNVKIRLLLSLLTLDGSKQVQLAQSVKSLLSKASESSLASQEKWVSVIVGLVYERLYGDDDNSGKDEDAICHVAKDTLKSTCATIIERITTQLKNAPGMDYEERPLESKYMKDPQTIMNLLESNDKNGDENRKSHFTYIGSRPNLMAGGVKRNIDEVEPEVGSQQSTGTVSTTSSFSKVGKSSKSNASSQILFNKSGGGDLRRKSAAEMKKGGMGSLGLAKPTTEKKVVKALSISDLKSKAQQEGDAKQAAATRKEEEKKEKARKRMQAKRKEGNGKEGKNNDTKEGAS